MAESISYRPHIDGLRAVAVLSVVVFHLKIFPLFGGFTGVDIFFTISGFLISKIIFSACADGSFSFLNFYAHRARRILPALLVVTALTLTTGLLFLYPYEYLRLTRSFVAALAFCANIYFYETADYFAASASDLPLLHLWSLGIEEQFYLAFPVIVLALFRFRRDLVPTALGLILLASLVASQVQLGHDPTASFYLLPYRAWELLVGALLAWPQRHHTSNVAVACTVGSVGLLLIGWSVFFLDTGMSFPGLNALPACIGAALVIWSGECAVSLPIRLLSIPPIVYVGRLSYSLYLYHWPLLFFANRLFPDAPHNSTIVLSHLSSCRRSVIISSNSLPAISGCRLCALCLRQARG